MLLNTKKTGPPRELGFGKYVTTNGRMMNADGSFNVRRQPVSRWDDTYYDLISMSPWQFLGWVVACYLTINIAFALLYVLLGIENLNGVTPGSFWDNFANAYFFSSQTLTTVGYGHISPRGLQTNIISAFESFSGLLFFALISGLLYGRFSRPVAKIVFSEKMLIAPFNGGKALMFRMGNVLKGELLETEAQVLFAINETQENGTQVRRFWNLELQLPKVTFFSLSWTVVHPLDDKSPISNLALKDFHEGKAEILVLIKAMEDSNQQIVHARRSYVADDIVENAKFKPIMDTTKEGFPLVITPKMGDYEVL
jgi:inward rectifier potassium channel